MFKAIHNYRENGGLINMSKEPDRRPYERLLGEFTGPRLRAKLVPTTAKECDADDRQCELDERASQTSAKPRKPTMVRRIRLVRA